MSRSCSASPTASSRSTSARSSRKGHPTRGCATTAWCTHISAPPEPRSRAAEPPRRSERIARRIQGENGMQPTTPRKRRSPLVRYAPFIVIVVVIAIVAVALAVSNKDKKKTAITPGGNAAPARDAPIHYQAAQKAGTVAKYTWQDHCDPATGRVAIPLLAPAPCVPKYDGQ